jgi:hypothetical protein
VLKIDFSVREKNGLPKGEYTYGYPQFSILGYTSFYELGITEITWISWENIHLIRKLRV